jgi:murein L,D-transpeptidase YcbB/YkuD
MNPLLLLGLLGGGAAVMLRKKPITGQTDDQLMATVNKPTMKDIEELTAIKAEFINRGRNDLATTVQNKIDYLKSPQAAQGTQTSMPEALKQQMASTLANMGIDANGNVVGNPTAASVAQATALAGQLDAAGYPAAAAYLRQMAQRAGLSVPSLPAGQQTPIPCVDAATQTTINRALQMERDPAVLQGILTMLQMSSCASTPAVQALITQLQALITNLKAAQTTGTTVNNLPIPGTTTPATGITMTPVESAAKMVVDNLNQVQAAAGGIAKSAHGKENKSLVMNFQKLAGLTADGKAGPGTVKALASIGHQCNLPLVMYWPTSANAKSVETYRADLLTIAATFDSVNSTCAAAVRLAASKERGTGGIVGAMPA